VEENCGTTWMIIMNGFNGNLTTKRLPTAIPKGVITCVFIKIMEDN